jgi:hypothetical protein
LLRFNASRILHHVDAYHKQYYRKFIDNESYYWWSYWVLKIKTEFRQKLFRDTLLRFDPSRILGRVHAYHKQYYCKFIDDESYYWWSYWVLKIKTEFRQKIDRETLLQLDPSRILGRVHAYHKQSTRQFIDNESYYWWSYWVLKIKTEFRHKIDRDTLLRFDASRILH